MSNKKGVDLTKKENIKDEEAFNEGPPMVGEYINWAGVNQSDLQTIIDFGFVQPAIKGNSKNGIILRRIILPPKVAKELGKILSK